MIKPLIKKSLFTFNLLLLSVPVLSPFGVASASAQASLAAPDQRPSMPSKHRKLKHAILHYSAKGQVYAQVPPGIYSSGILVQPPDELTPLMPAFWTGDLVLPWTVPPQSPSCELISRPDEKPAAPRGTAYRTVEGYVFPCWQNQP